MQSSFSFEDEMLMANLYFSTNSTSLFRAIGQKEKSTKQPSSPISSSSNTAKGSGPCNTNSPYVIEDSTNDPNVLILDSDTEYTSTEARINVHSGDLPNTPIDSLSGLPEDSFLLDANGDINFEIEGDEESNRYFGKKKTSASKCFYCGQYGHIAKECQTDSSQVLCTLCIAQGHSRQECLNLLCYNCKMIGHQSKQCAFQKRRFASERDICALCANPGHLSVTCSINTWRKYLYNSDKTPLSAQLKSSSLDTKFKRINSYCFSCSKKGHFGDECKRYSTRISETHWSAFHQYSDAYLKNCLMERKLRKGIKGHKQPII